jgi:hypothetical protein
MIDLTQDKLREAEYFCQQLNAKRDKPELFKYYLHAFLSSARAVTFVLQYEEKEKYDRWFPAWLQERDEKDQQLFKLMVGQRNSVEKRGGAETILTWEFIPITEITEEAKGHPAYGFSFFAPPGTPAPSVGRAAHFFTGSSEQVTSDCKRYLSILTELVREFAAAHVQ